MQSEEPVIIQSLEDHLAEYGHTTVGQDIAAAILVIRDLHQKAALSAAEPVAVKALEWAADENHLQLQRADFYTIESEFRQGFALHTAGRMGAQWFSTEDKAKAAAQTDYETRIRSAQVQDVAGWQPPQDCDGKEQLAFEAWAGSNRYDMHEHPLHYLFMDAKTNAARQGWKAALQYVRDQFPAAPAKQEGGHVTSQ